MSPKILLVGGGHGSWQIRGVQLGRAIGARVTSSPTMDECAWADVIVLVKHAVETWGERALQSKALRVWDVLDVWTQPDDNAVPMPEQIARIEAVRRRYGIDLVIGATRAMADALGGVYLPHHSRPGLLASDIRPTLDVVAYEGTRKYLGSWRAGLEQACTRLGVRFLVNPPDLREADLVVAFRGERHDGAVCRQWKSGVKLVNAVAAGRPVLSQASAAMQDIQPAGTVVDDPDRLVAAIDAWQPVEVRQRALIDARARASEFSLETIARRYHGMLDRAWRQAA